MDKEDVVYTYAMEYYLAMRKNEILPFAAMWMELKGIMVSEISQWEKKTSYVFTHMWILRNLTEDQGEGKGREKKLQRGKEANHKGLLNTENKLRLMGVGGGKNT